jgi:hypothetical protein
LRRTDMDGGSKAVDHVVQITTLPYCLPRVWLTNDGDADPEPMAHQSRHGGLDLTACPRSASWGLGDHALQKAAPQRQPDDCQREYHEIDVPSAGLPT